MSFSIPGKILNEFFGEDLNEFCSKIFVRDMTQMRSILYSSIRKEEEAAKRLLWSLTKRLRPVRNQLLNR